MLANGARGSRAEIRMKQHCASRTVLTHLTGSPESCGRKESACNSVLI